MQDRSEESIYGACDIFYGAYMLACTSLAKMRWELVSCALMGARKPVVFDIETQYTFRDYTDHKKLGVSVVAAYDYTDEHMYVFTEDELSGFFSLLERASYIVGYNIRSFDLPVLQAYYPGNIATLPVFDMLEDIRDKIGRRISLNDLAGATLNVKKSGMGLMAIDYYREGRIDELKQYCADDVAITRDLFNHGIANNEVFYKNEMGKIPIKVKWNKYMDDLGLSQTDLTLPF